MPSNVGEHSWSVGAHLSWGSTAVIQSSGTESLTLDAETREARFTLQHSITDRLALQLQLPYRYTGGGNLDAFIDSWHDTFGMSEGARPALPSDQLNISYSKAGSSQLNMSSAAEGLADIQAALGYQINPSMGAWLNVKLPTGDADELTGSGATDVSLLLAAQHRLDDRWSIFGQGAVTWLGDGDILPERQRSVVWSGLAGVSWQAWRGLSLKAQVDAHTAAFDSNLDFLNEAVVLTVGGDYQFASGWRLDLGVSEDIAVERSPDVVFLASMMRDW